MTALIIDISGWIGSLLLIYAYYSNSRNTMNAQSFTYQLLNVIGSLLLIINTVYYGAYPSAAVNIIWVFIGLHYLTANSKNAKEAH